MKKNNCWIFIIISILVITFFVIFSFDKPKLKDLKLWNDLSTKREIINYVSDVTNNNSKNYIPIEDRIAVFDLDGTLYNETPMYLSRKIYKYRVLEDSNYNATDKQIEAANNIKSGLNANINASIYTGMTIEQYENYINDFLINKNLKSDFYQPMLQLITYLQDNNFTIYICSGTDYYLVRTLVKDVIDIPDNQIIGTQPVLNNNILVGKYLDKNVNKNKIKNIKNIIGKVPVLAFGNSGSDYDMLNYTIANNKYKSKSFIVVNDDLKQEKNILKKEAKKNKWKIISMKKDWKTIYEVNT